MSGDGSAAHPWHTLEEVIQAGLFASTPTAPSLHYPQLANRPIQPGDTVYLLSGDHGAVVIQGYYANQVGFYNSGYITIAALPGQTPVLESLKIIGGAYWAFRGLTFQGLNTSGSYQTASGGSDYHLITLSYVHSNIIIDSSTIMSAPSTSGWTVGQWLTQRSSGIIDSQGTCIAITNNTIQNIGFAISSQRSDSVLISGNTINYFTDDAIDYGSNDMLIQNNLIENSIEDSDGFHRDAMQGQPYTSTTQLNNISITGNTVIRMSDPNIPYPGYLQGIGAYDGLWTNLVVSNNVVITDGWDGIAFYGVSNASITNNYLLMDNGANMACDGLTAAQCQAQGINYVDSAIPFLGIQPSKTGVPSTNLNISNNIVTSIQIDGSTTSSTIAHNLCLLTNGSCPMAYPVSGTLARYGKPGVYGADNVVPNFGASALFVQFDTTGMQYNLQLAVANPAS